MFVYIWIYAHTHMYGCTGIHIGDIYTDKACMFNYMLPFLVAHVCVCLIAFSSLLKLSSYWFLMPIFSSGKSFIKYLILWDISVSFLGILLLIICQLMRYFKSLSKSSNFQDISKFFYCKCALLNIATFS